MIEVKNVSRHFGKNGLDNTSIHVKKGELLGVSGASGCGKTTLLNIISGMLRPESGSVIINGQDIGRLTENKRTALRAGTIGYMMQGSVLLPEFTVIQNIMLTAGIAGKKCSIAQAKELCKELKIYNIINSYPVNISGGEYRRVMLARILSADTPILIADEPTSNLDEESADIVRKKIYDVHKKGVCIITATHDKKLLELADSILEL